MRAYSLAYLTSSTLTPPQAIRLAAELGYQFVGLRLQPNVPGAPQQMLIGQPDILRETLAAMRETGVGVFDIEIIRLSADVQLATYLPLLEAGAALNAKAVLVAGDDINSARLADNYARLCDMMAPFGLTADLEFMPWTAVPNAQSAMQIVNAAGNPDNAGILIDAIHFARSNTTLDDIRAIPTRLLHYAQICDAPANVPPEQLFTVEELVHAARCERLLPGEGIIDLNSLFATLPADLPVSVEIPHHLRLSLVSQTEWARSALAASQIVSRSVS